MTWKNVGTLLKQALRLEQVSQWLTLAGLPSVNSEWIYRYILTDKDTGGDWYTYLRCQKKGKKRHSSTDSRVQLKNRVSINERPLIVAERKRVGDWELDTVIGHRGGVVLVTAVERKTRCSVIALAPNKTAEAMKQVILDVLSPLVNWIKTLTYDNGKEFALHEDIADVVEAKLDFVHPYHS